MAAEVEIAELVRNGVAVIVATRDEDLRPEVSRAWGPALSEDGARLTVCVEAAPGSVMARNLESGRPAAATIARLTSQTTVQVKGTVAEVAAPTPDRLAAVSEHVDDFVAETALVGVPEAIARALVGPKFLTVTIEIAERFDEAPGAGEDTPA